MQGLDQKFNSAALVVRFAAHDLRTRCLGSALGFAWAFVQPFVMTIILWLVVGFAFKAGAVRGVPFIAWLLAGMSAWSFFADALNQATPVFCEYSFLVKKINFNLSVLPLVKIIATLVVHALFLLIVAVVLVFNGVSISWSWAAVSYYLFAAAMLIAGAGYITATLHVFMRDIAHVVNIALQFGFWVTPVFWDFPMLREHPLLVTALRLNPVVYIVEGYRNCLLFNDPFAGGWGAAAWFWLLTAALLVAGRFLFRKLKPQFADVL